MRTIHWQLSLDCNLKCRYCWNKTRNTRVSTLPTQRIKELLAEIATLGKDQVIFTGGEPLLRTDIFDLLKHGLTQGLHMTLFTNGVLFTPDRIMALNKLSSFETLCLVFSIDAPTAQTNNDTRGHTDTLLKNIKELRESGTFGRIKTLFNTVLTQNNITQVEDLLGFSLENGIAEHRFDLGIFHPPEAYPKDLVDLDLIRLPSKEITSCFDGLCCVLEKYKNKLSLLPISYCLMLRDYLLTQQVPRLNCRAGENFCFITPTGLAFRCFEQTQKPLADLREDSFASLDLALNHAALRKEVFEEQCKTPRCICSFIQYPHSVLRHAKL